MKHELARLLLPASVRLKLTGLPRPATRFVNAYLKPSLVVAEIGVGWGMNARSILETLNVKKLFLVDPYETYLYRGDMYFQMEKVYPQVVRRLRKWSDKTVFEKTHSEKAVQLVPDHLDFVYIDANHTYDDVKKDLELWHPKVKHGGVLGGHDFEACWPGVVSAVQQFGARYDLKLEGEGNDWWFIKP